MKHSTGQGAPIDQLKGEIEGTLIEVGPVKRPANRPKENEALATEVAYAYWRLLIEGVDRARHSEYWLPGKQIGLRSKQAAWRICERYQISRAYLFKLVRQVVNRPEY
jgi:hypothetical protein